MKLFKNKSFSCIALSLLATPLYANNCTNLLGAKTPPPGATSAIITSAQIIPPNDANEPTGVEHCRIKGIIDVDPNDPGRIEFLLRLPTTTWNGKLLHSGNGGWGGDEEENDPFYLQGNFWSMWPHVSAIQRGYATILDDTGHETVDHGENGSWALDIDGTPGKIDNEREINFIGRSIHLSNLFAKSIIHSFYGNPANKSYYMGCSTGGQQGMYVLSAYPTDFDGALIGTPANFTSMENRIFWQQKLLRELDVTFTPEQLNLVTQKALQKCDTIDGIQDGILNDPTKCTAAKFNPLLHLPLCIGSSQANCFSVKQLLMLELLYLGPLIENGSQGLVPSSEATLGILGPSLGFPLLGWHDWVTKRNPVSWGAEEVREFTRYFFFDNPNFDWENYLNKKSLVQMYLDIHNNLSPYDMPNKSLSAFKNRGGKLIMYQGWLDPHYPAKAAIDLYKTIYELNGGLTNTQKFARLYVIPGGGHCFEGLGAFMFDGLTALEKWSENNQAPNGLTAFTVDALLTGEQKSRPLCPYPKVAKIVNPSGNIYNANNFTCANP